MMSMDTDSDDDSPFERRSGSCSRWLRGGACRLCFMFCLIYVVSSILGFLAFLSMCRHGYTTPASQALGLGGDDSGLGWWAMAAKQPLDDLQRAQRQLYKQQTRVIDGANLSFGVAIGSAAPKLMYDATRVPGVWEQVPAKLRGIFLVRDEAAGSEELMALQYGRWDEQGSLLVVPTAPWSYAWLAGSAADAAEASKGFYYFPDEAERRSADSIVDAAARSYRFSEEPSLASASVQVHPAGQPQVGRAPNEFAADSALSGLLIGTQTFQEDAGAEQGPGTTWRSVEQWSVLSCSCVQHRTLTFEKILDANGEPVEPQHSDFLRRSSGNPFYLWTGWPSERARQEAAARSTTRSMESPR